MRHWVMESGMAAREKLVGMLGFVSFGLGRRKNDRCPSGCGMSR